MPSKMIDIPPRRARALRIAAYSCLAAVVLMAAMGLMVGVEGGSMFGPVSLLGLLASLGACVALLIASRSQPADVRRAWTLISAGISTGVVASAVEGVFQHLFWRDAWSAWLVVALYLGGYGVAAIGLWMLPGAGSALRERAPALIDGVAGAVGIGVLVWYGVYRPYVEPLSATDLLRWAPSAVYLLGDVVVLMSVVAIMSHRRRYTLGHSPSYLTAALTFLCLADILYLMSQSATRSVAPLWIQFMWALSAALMAATALSLLHKNETREVSTPTRVWRGALPYMAGVTLAALSLFTVTSNADRVIVAGVLVILTLIAFRQRVASREEARALAKQRNDLIASISHELRTPLTVVTGYLSLLRESADLVDPVLKEMVQTAAEQAVYLGRIVTDLIEVTRGTQLRVNPQRGDLSAACRKAVQALADTDGSDVELAWEIEDGLEAVFDEARLNQALSNLITNARRYGDSKILVTMEANSDRASISVHDNGPGVPPQYRDTIWDEFDRGPYHLDSAVPGSGLGLAICRSIAEAHRGEISYSTSERLGGACFTIRLPLATGD